MSISFPSRFLKKLNIYQEIRRGQGIDKYKQLWKYESAFLKVAYSEAHQHLNSFSDKNQLIDWIKIIYPEYEREDYEQIIGNLFYKEYLEARDKENNSPSTLTTRYSLAVSNHVLAQKFEYRVTPEGLLVGEVLSEINSNNFFLRFWHNYRYELTIDTVWLLVFFGIYKLLFPANSIIAYLSFQGGYQLKPVAVKLAVLFSISPAVGYLYRKFLARR